MASSFCLAKTQTCTLSSLTILLVDSVAPVTDRTRYRYPRVLSLSLSLFRLCSRSNVYARYARVIREKGFVLSSALRVTAPLSHFPNISARYHRCYYRNPNYTADEVERGGVIIENFIVRPLPRNLKRLNRDTYNTDNLSVKIPPFSPFLSPSPVYISGAPWCFTPRWYPTFRR